MKNENTDFIIGRHPAVMALKSDQEVNRVFIQSGLKVDAIFQIVKLAREHHLVVSNVPKNRLDLVTDRQNHQGVMLAVAAYQYATIDDLFSNVVKHDEDPFFLILNELEDPHNLGSVVRAADAAGVHGIIIPHRQAVGLTSVATKTSTGAIEHVSVARVANLVQTAKELQERGVWLLGTDMKGKDYQTWDAHGTVALVIDSEGERISSLLKKTRDEILTIPMIGHAQSLSANVVTGLLVYQGFNSRHPLK